MSKWLILRAREQTDAGVEPYGADVSGVDAETPVPRPRTPTGQPGLPGEWLFSVALEPVVIIDASSQCIVQANPAAAELLQRPQASLLGLPLVEIFEESSREALEHSFNTVQAAGNADEVACRSAGGVELHAKLSLFRTGAESFVLVRLASKVRDNLQSRPHSPVFEAIEGASVGFLLTDSGLRIEYANQAFIDMVELPPPVEMRGKSLVQWLQLTADDLARLRDQMLQREATSVMTARLRTERDSPLEVEVCAVAVPDGPHTCWGFTIREMPRLN